TMNHLLEELDSADMAPTPAMTGAYAAVCTDLVSGLTAWRTVQSKQLKALNAKLTASGAPVVPVPAPIAAPVCPAASTASKTIRWVCVHIPFLAFDCRRAAVHSR